MLLSLKIAIIVLVSFPVARACVCAGTPTVAESFSKATVVFEGTVINRGKFGAWLRIDRSWKGATPRRVYLYTGNLRNDCDPWFGTFGERWLVYARFISLYRYKNSKTPNKLKLMAPACDRTTTLASAAEDLRVLASLSPLNRP